MKKIFVHIEYLLLEHDCVIIPQLGGFLTQDVPSEWIEEESLFLPPYRTVRFNERLNHGNTLLVDTLAQCWSVTPAEAEKQVAQFVQHIRMELLENGSIDFGSIGVMMQEGAGQPITFSPCKAGVTTPALYGLDSFRMEKISATRQQPAAAPSAPAHKQPADNADGQQPYVVKFNRTLVHAMAAVAASIILFVLTATPLANTDSVPSGQVQANLFVPHNLQPMAAAVEMIPEARPAEPVTAAEEPAAPKAEPKPAPAPAPKAAPKAEPKVAPKAEPKVAPKPAPAPASKAAPKAKPAPKAAPAPKAKPAPKAQKPAMAIVLASVTNMANAEAFAASLQAKGYDAHVYQKDKMVRVIIPCYENKEAAIAKMKAVRENPALKDAWLTPLE